VWLAGRYDKSSVIVYFQAVKFGDTFPADAQTIPTPIADAFFTPKVVGASALTKFQQALGAERFAIGDRYDVLLGNGRTGTITLRTLVAFESDEFVGNDSYIGALGALASEDLPFVTGDYFVVRRHQVTSRAAGANRSTGQPASFSRLVTDPVSQDVQTEVTALLRKRLTTAVGVPTGIQSEIDRTQPSSLRVKQLTLVDGSVRYHVWADFRLRQTCLAASAWVGSQPLRIVAIEEPLCELNGLDPIEPQIRNVVDLGERRVGLVVDFQGGDGRSLRLLEYRDEAGFADMQELQSVSAGE
jgi:hypothetical protein